MTCAETKHLLNAYADGELDSMGSLAVEQHVRGCASCRAELENLHALSAVVSSGGLRFSAPPRLKANVQRAIRSANPEARHSFVDWRWVAALASAVFVLAAAWVVTTQRSAASEQTLLVKDIVASHVRSMMANHITDVASSDSHTVKPWFGGKLDYSPPTKDLTEQGFRLIGGRLDYVGGRPVAALVYQRSQHFINLFVWPANGTDLIHWTRSGMTYWLVSELNTTELSECARLLKE
jgi:anti-sigma factor RsiW